MRIRYAALLAMLLATAACTTKAPAGDGAGADAIPAIAGGVFEASGTAWVQGTNTLLFVDDGRTRQIFAIEVSDTGEQLGAAVAIPIAADVTDMEGMTFDGSSFYAVGSQSKRRGHDGDGLVRFRYDTVMRRTHGVERIAGLKAWLADNVVELRGTGRLLGDHILNIEAIAWDPASRRLLLGLRAPVVDGQALIIPLRHADANGPLTLENLRADSTIRLNLGGAGIRALEYDDEAKGFMVISGASLDREDHDFRLLEWDGRSPVPAREVALYHRAVKPEGITRARLGTRSARVLVFDTGRFAIRD